MRVVFHNRFLHRGKVLIATAGIVQLIDGEVVITPPHFNTWLRKQKSLYLVDLNPRDGEKYLKLLPQVFRGVDFYAELLD